MAVEGTDRTDRADKLTKAEIIESIYAEVPVSKSIHHQTHGSSPVRLQ